MDKELIITLVSALAGAASFALFALPFLNRSEKKERFRSVIEKRRKALFQATRDNSLKRVDKESLSAKDSIATFYRLQQLAGRVGERARDKMLQAGNRDPKAPFKFMIAQAVLPVVFCMLAMMFISGSEQDLSNGMTIFILLGAGCT